MERTIGNLLNSLPGYTGYRSKEDRRDDDRRLREAIAKSLDGTTATLTGVSAKLAQARSLTHISTIERLVGSTRQLADRVRTASYGYGGIFSDRSVDEFALDQLRQFDNAFQQEAAKLDSLANRLAGSAGGPLETDIQAYEAELLRLGTLFDARGAVVDTARPNQDASVLALLEPPATPRVSPFSALRIGDALSVLGDDYIVDATVTFTERERTVTLARVGEGSDGNATWLVGGTTEDVGSATLTEAPADSISTASGRTAQAVVASKAETGESVPAQYAYTATNGSTVTFWYSIGGETRSYTGKSIEDSDISVYGQA